MCVGLDAGEHVQAARETATAAFSNVVIRVLCAADERVTRWLDRPVQVLVVVDLCLQSAVDRPRCFTGVPLSVRVRITDQIPDEQAERVTLVAGACNVGHGPIWQRGPRFI